MTKTNGENYPNIELSVIIPVYNEINTVSEILRRVKAVPINKEIIIIDDGSTDGTREVLKKLKGKNIRVFFNKRNRGKGFSIRKGFPYARGRVVIIQDADLEYFPDEYPLLTSKIVEGKADVVYGTRFQGARRVFYFYHYLGNKLLNLIANFLYNTNLSDLMTGYKAFRGDLLCQLDLRADGFGIEAEITAQVFKRHWRVYEVPISYNGRDYDEGKKINWKDFFRSVYWLIKSRFSSFDIGQDTLCRMRLMKNNNRWLFKRVKPYLGERILEVGSGIGNISAFLASLKRHLFLTDINDRYLESLRRRFMGNPQVKVFHHDILSANLTRIKSWRVDTIVCMNVLEHLKDDHQAFSNIHKLLARKGRLVLVVPALKFLYGSLDKNLGHLRRYEKEELVGKLKEAKFIVERIYFHNFLATFGWFINSRVFKKEIMSGWQIGFFDKFIPLLAVIEKKIRIPFGLSLIVVGKKK